MRIAVTGASGLIGSALIPALREHGHDVLRFVRRLPREADEVRWDPSRGGVQGIDPDSLTGVNAVVHLSGAGVGDRRWTEAYKKEILESRVRSTRTIAAAIARADNGPSVFISASAIGFYGQTGDSAVDETAPRGEGFLAEVTEAWEGAAEDARVAGVRVVHPRSGLVMSSKGGAWGRMLPLFRLGVGGTLGSGRQYWSFISMRDELSALKYLLTADLAGPVNLTAPNPATNAEVTSAMSRALRRPAILPVPSLALKIALGEFSSEVLGSLRVVPTALMNSGFTFADPTIDAALASMLSD
jgi:uncharacterized protein